MYPFHRTLMVFLCILILGFLQACNQPGFFQTSSPRFRRLPRKLPPLPPVVAPPPKQTATPKPVLTESKIKEQELEASQPSPPRLSPRGGTSSLSSGPKFEPRSDEAISVESGIREKDLGEGGLGREQLAGKTMPGEGMSPMSSENSLSTQPEELSLIAKITPETPPQQAVSLRLAEQGRRFLENHEYEKGKSKLEKSISLDSRNRYGYYYLAKAHYLLTRYKLSLNFLEIIESMFAEEPNWSSRVRSLQGKNYAGLGLFDRADVSYAKALKLDSNNRVAFKGITEMKLEFLNPSR